MPEHQPANNANSPTSQRAEPIPPQQMMRFMRVGPGRHGPMGPVQKAKNIQGTVRRLGGYLRHQSLALTGVMVLVLLTTGLNVASPFLIGRAIDQAIVQRNLSALSGIVLLLIAVYAASATTTWLQVYVMSAVAQRTIKDIRQQLFSKIQTLPLRYFDQHPHGELMSRLSNDVENISQVLSDGVTQFLASIFTIIGVAVMMVRLNLGLAVVSLVTIPLMLLLTKWIGSHTREGYRERQRALGTLNGFIEETVTGQRVVKAYGREQAATATFEKANQDLRYAAIHAQIYTMLLGPLSNFVNNTGFAIVAGAGGWMAVHNLATVGTIASFLTYTRQFGHPLGQLANLYNAIQSAIAGAERVFEILDEPPELEDAVDVKPLPDVHGEVILNDVCFGYVPQVQVLKEVSLHAKPGQMIALVGPTGAGKTTIVSVLTRFYEIDSGSIQIDGTDIRRLKKADLRRQLGIVLQDNFLFSASVMENIRYGRLEATDEEVMAAAKLAGVDHFVHHLPQGYATQLSERGSNLSQGQRQLLSIARAILADPGILILDEATSSVDTRTEIHIQQALLRLMEGRTSFVIAHRLSTIRNADQVIVINDGRLIEHGTHTDLLNQRGFYYNLYMSQFKGTKHVYT